MLPRHAAFAELDPATLYALLKLRVDVFVVEQRCPYPELDGRDVETGTRHFWFADGGAPVAYLRLLAEPAAGGTDVARIGRVCTARTHRGTGLARRLLDAALVAVADRPCVLEAQAHLVDYYRRAGFAPVGAEYLDDGIPHVPMRRG